MRTEYHRRQAGLPPLVAPHDIADCIDMGGHAGRPHPCLGLQGCGLEFDRQIQPRQRIMLSGELREFIEPMHHRMTGSLVAPNRTSGPKA